MPASNIVNDNNTITNVVESTLSGSSGSNFTIKNDGTLAVSEYVSSTLKSILQVIVGTGVNIGAVSRQVEILGNLQIDGSLIVTSITLTVPINGATIIITGTATGPKINLTVGSLTRIVSGTTSVPQNGNVVVTHGLGATPDIVCPIMAAVGGSAGSYLGIEVDTYTSTQFTLHQYNASAATSTIAWIAIKL